MRGRGRIVIPAAVRAERGLAEGTPLVLVDEPTGLIVMTREQLEERVLADFAGHDLVGALLAERRHASAAEDAV